MVTLSINTIYSHIKKGIFLNITMEYLPGKEKAAMAFFFFIAIPSYKIFSSIQAINNKKQLYILLAYITVFIYRFHIVLNSISTIFPLCSVFCKVLHNFR